MKTLQKLGSICALVGASAVVSCSFSERPRYERTIQVSDNQVRYRVSQEEGEQMLIDTARTAEREDAWVYRQRNGESEWIDVGTCAGVGVLDELSMGNYIEIDYSLISDVRARDSVTLYHIHVIRSVSSFNRLFFMTVSDVVRCQLPSWRDWWRHSQKHWLAERGVRVQPSRVVGEYITSSYECEGKSEEQVRTEIANLYHRYFPPDAEDIPLSLVPQLLEELTATLAQQGYQLTIHRLELP